MRSWATLLGGLGIWAVHFFVLYAFGEFARDTRATRLAICGFTLLCLGLSLTLFQRLRSAGDDGFEQWQRDVGKLALLLSVIAITWQGLVPLL